MKRVWSNLDFYITNPLREETLLLGENGFNIVAEEDVFTPLITFPVGKDEGRILNISVYLNTMNDTSIFNDFFDETSVYRLRIVKDSVNYYCDVKIAEAIEQNGIKTLYSKDNIILTIKLQLLSDKDFFLTDVRYSKAIGAGINDLFRFNSPVSVDEENFVFSILELLTSHIIDNRGNDNNGIYLQVEPSKLLTNPKFVNKTTGFTMAFNLICKGGDTLEIDTNGRWVKLNGNYLYNVKKIQHKWLTLQKGLNTVEFLAETGAETATVFLKYRDKYRGL